MRVTSGSSLFSRGGDSGAVVLGSLTGGADYWLYTYKHSNAARILGLNFASDRNGSNAYFSPINAVIHDIGTLTNFY